MPELIVRDAAPAEVGQVCELLIRDRERDPLFPPVTGWRRWLFRSVVVPRYLRRAAITWILEQDGAMAGYAVLEQRGLAVYVSELSVIPGFDRAGLIAIALKRAAELARERDYHYLRTAPADNSDDGLAPYRAAGFELLDYYLWAYTGQLAAGDMPRAVRLQPLPGSKALERRRYYLRQELDASQAPARDLVDAAYLPSKPPQQRAYEIEYLADDGAQSWRAIGYLAPRPNERRDGVLTLVLSLEPAHWGSELETHIVAGLGDLVSAGQPASLRLLLSTTAHCQRADAGLAQLGLQRRLDSRPILYKPLQLAPAG